MNNAPPTATERQNPMMRKRPMMNMVSAVMVDLLIDRRVAEGEAREDAQTYAWNALEAFGEGTPEFLAVALRGGEMPDADALALLAALRR